jgi:hypothetical protein
MTLPTELGNVLRAADAYSEQRYGMDALVVLPRLLRTAPSEMASELRDLREDIQFASDLSGALALISGLSLALVAPAYRWDTHWWYAVPAVAALASWVSYRNAVTAAVAYGEAQRVVFDLQRWSLYEALRLAPPRSSEEERELARRLSEFLLFGSPIPEVYYMPPPAAGAS